MMGIHSNKKPNYDATLTLSIRDKGDGVISCCTLTEGILVKALICFR